MSSAIRRPRPETPLLKSAKSALGPKPKPGPVRSYVRVKPLAPKSPSVYKSAEHYSSGEEEIEMDASQGQSYSPAAGAPAGLGSADDETESDVHSE